MLAISLASAFGLHSRRIWWCFEFNSEPCQGRGKNISTIEKHPKTRIKQIRWKTQITLSHLTNSPCGQRIGYARSSSPGLSQVPNFFPVQNSDFEFWISAHQVRQIVLPRAFPSTGFVSALPGPSLVLLWSSLALSGPSNLAAVFVENLSHSKSAKIGKSQSIAANRLQNNSVWLKSRRPGTPAGAVIFRLLLQRESNVP